MVLEKKGAHKIVHLTLYYIPHYRFHIITAAMVEWWWRNFCFHMSGNSKSLKMFRLCTVRTYILLILYDNSSDPTLEWIYMVVGLSVGVPITFNQHTACPQKCAHLSCIFLRLCLWSSRLPYTTTGRSCVIYLHKIFKWFVIIC